MFYEVKVFDARGELKKVISSKKLSNRFWKQNSNSVVDFSDAQAVTGDWDHQQSLKNNEFSLSDDY